MTRYLLVVDFEGGVVASRRCTIRVSRIASSESPDDAEVAGLLEQLTGNPVVTPRAARLAR
jgi:hypothetical protein